MKTNFCILVVLLLQLQTCSGLKVMTPSKTVTALLGSSAIVPCDFKLQTKQMNPNLLHVKWGFGEKELLTFPNNEMTSYGRATMNLQAAMNGDVSLRLYDLTIEDEGTYTCSVEYDGKKMVKGVTLRILASPSVEVTRSSTKSDDETHVDCVVKRFYPQNIKVTWYKNGKILSNNVVTGEPRRDENGTYNVKSTLTIYPTEMQKKDVAVCQVEHISLGTPIKGYFTTTPFRFVSKTKGPSKSKNSIVLVVVSSTIVVIAAALCRALYWGLCYRRKSKPNVSDEESVIATGEYEADDEQVVIEMGEYEAAKPNVSEDEQVVIEMGEYEAVAELSRCPRMGKITVPRLVNGKKARLECTISGYSPQNLEVTWLWVGPVNRNVCRVSSNEKWSLNKEETRQEDHTYTCTASLTVNVCARDEHTAQYICQISHPSLKSPVERRTGNLKVIAIPEINVTYDVSKDGVNLTTEIRSVHPYPVHLTWSRLKKDKYVGYAYTVFKDEWHLNCDGTFDVISKLKDKRRLIKDKAKYFKVTIKHESLESPIEKTILREKGVYYLVTEDGNTPLPEASKEKAPVCVWIPRKNTPFLDKHRDLRERDDNK